MSSINCGACLELRDNAAEFVQNGVTDQVCESLTKNTGFNPNLSVLHDNCEDLKYALDCLIGRMDSQLESYDVCDWKTFMHRFIPNLYELLKAMMCGDCGQWSMINAICSILHEQMDYQLESYGTLMGSYYDAYPNRWGGEVGTKNGTPLVTEPNPRDPYGNLGFRYKRFDSIDCNGEPYTYEWLIPQVSFLTLGDVENGDILYKVAVSYAKQNWGFTDNMINYLRQFPQFWYGLGSRNGYDMENDFTVRVGVDANNDMYIMFVGSQGAVKNRYVQKVPVNGPKVFTQNEILH